MKECALWAVLQVLYLAVDNMVIVSKLPTICPSPQSTIQRPI